MLFHLFSFRTKQKLRKRSNLRNKQIPIENQQYDNPAESNFWSRERTPSPEDDSVGDPDLNSDEEPTKPSCISKFSAGIEKNIVISHKTDSGDILLSPEYFEYESTDLNSLNIENIRSMLILQPRDMNLNETVILENAPSQESVENSGSSTSEATPRIDKPKKNEKLSAPRARISFLRVLKNVEEIAWKTSHKG
ncbi:hypothetical protein HHI36_012751 [Cryptolaemus montrouzieri]|uniref:Uncharacterized protein n=1 Tax=Cryptolaemus montrouzieri TaxID=559131 RepID=A0ABD2NFC5_9CUCU